MNFLKKLGAVGQIVWRWNRAADKGAKSQYDAALQEIFAAEKAAEKVAPLWNPRFYC